MTLKKTRISPHIIFFRKWRNFKSPNPSGRPESAVLGGRIFPHVRKSRENIEIPGASVVIFWHWGAPRHHRLSFERFCSCVFKPWKKLPKCPVQAIWRSLLKFHFQRMSRKMLLKCLSVSIFTKRVWKGVRNFGFLFFFSSAQTTVPKVGKNNFLKLRISHVQTYETGLNF